MLLQCESERICSTDLGLFITSHEGTSFLRDLWAEIFSPQTIFRDQRDGSYATPCTEVTNKQRNLQIIIWHQRTRHGIVNNRTKRPASGLKGKPCAQRARKIATVNPLTEWTHVKGRSFPSWMLEMGCFQPSVTSPVRYYLYKMNMFLFCTKGGFFASRVFVVKIIHVKCFMCILPLVGNYIPISLLLKGRK